VKCPKCNYTSFDYLDSCKKCGKDLSEHREKHAIRSVLFATAVSGAGGVAAVADNFEFDFNEEEEPLATKADRNSSPTAEPVDDPFGLGEDSGDFNFDGEDSFSFDDDEL
jgi:hypothetical protein